MFLTKFFIYKMRTCRRRYLLKRVAEDQGLGVSWDQDAAAPASNARDLYGDNATEYDASDDECGEYGSYQEGPRRPLRCCFSYSTTETRIAPHGLGAVQVQLARLQAAHLHHQVRRGLSMLESNLNVLLYHGGFSVCSMNLCQVTLCRAARTTAWPAPGFDPIF